MADTIAPIQAFTPDNHGAVVTVASLVSIFSLLPVLGARVWITINRKLGFQSDDMLFTFAAAILPSP
jgi:hypothetical protein